MARISRIVVPEIPHHVVNRGNRSQRVFFKEADYRFFLDLLVVFSKTYNVEIISYCLMPNHFHLIAIPSKEDALTQMMNDTQKSYTRMVNFRESWRGCLWQGRYFSTPMSDAYTLRTMRYIELNPVKAKLSKKFDQYSYSSAKFHLGQLQDKVIKATYLNWTPKEWRAFVAEGIDQKEYEFINNKTKSGRPMGNEAFVKKLEKLTHRKLGPLKRGPKSGKLS